MIKHLLRMFKPYRQMENDCLHWYQMYCEQHDAAYKSDKHVTALQEARKWDAATIATLRETCEEVRDMMRKNAATPAEQAFLLESIKIWSKHHAHLIPEKMDKHMKAMQQQREATQDNKQWHK